MNNLYELGRLNERNVAIIEALIPENQSSPLRRLTKIVFAQNNLDDEKCMLEIYGKRNLTAFSRLKSRLKDLMYLVLLIQDNFGDDNEAALVKSLHNLRNAVVGKILLAKRATDLSLELTEKELAKSIKNHFTENVIIQSRLLISTYGASRYNKYKYQKYTDIQNKYLRYYTWELKADSYFFELQKNQMQSLAAPTKELIQKASIYVKELEKVNDIHTPNFLFSKYRILAAYYEYIKEYEKLLKISDKAINDFLSPTIKSSVIVANIYVRKIWALIQSDKINEASTFGKSKLANVYQGSFAWYRIGYYTVKAFLYKNEYKNAIEILISLMDHPKYQKIDNYYIELFNTTLGYVYLLANSGIVGSSKDFKKKLPEFKLGRFLNTTPVFSKDKRGINVSILLMHIAFLLQRKDFDSIIDRIDSLNQYAYRYLRRDDSFRSNCMIKMVIQMTKADFNPVRTERYTADLFKQLKSVKLAGSGENIEIEVIPFEVLWEIMIKAL